LFWRERFPGFWPPEMGFCMELIPLLRAMGYLYVLVDSEHVEPLTPMDWEELRYRPHLARHGDDEIVVVVRDRDLSNAQESGMEPGWFFREVEARTRWCDFPPLVTTCTDGENGGWFRNTTPGANFWTAFYQPLLEQARGDRAVVKPVFISEYLDRFGAHGEVRVRTGAWNTGWHHGRDFTQWTGSWRQRQVLEEMRALSADLQQTRWRAAELGPQEGEIRAQLEQSLWRLMRAETSCNLYWGEAWVERAENDLEQAAAALARAKAGMVTESQDVGC
jgi:alpha-amylase/alpha-mannosidase (GH57 family)